ncbi:MAG: diguanylate cyclase [Clostridiales bacterium]|nr:diguanylate cyclase [Clostridiales bacterium]
MESGRGFFSVKLKMYIFVATTVLVVAFGTAAITFSISANRINSYYRQSASDNARNVASMLDGDYLARLRKTIRSGEYQAVRKQAVEEDNEELVEDFLRDRDLWNEYIKIRQLLSDYLSNMEGIEYVYVIDHGDADAIYDMYLIDDDSTPLYETGYFELREEELRETDLTDLPDPTITNGDWGWLCSDFKPVYDSEGNCVCIVGCDISMEEVMLERTSFLISMILGALVYTAIVIAGAMVLVDRVITKPIVSMTKEMKRFNPTMNKDYETAGVMELDIQSNDEISEIYQGIRNMQMSIVDDLKDKVKAENDLKNKDQRIDKLSDQTAKDALTGVGSKAAFIRKSEMLGRQSAKEGGRYAVVMADLNNLKHVNDEYGHKAGDTYITGCCDMISGVFANSTVYRIGGDEFVVILQGDDYENRIALTEKLRSDFEESFSQEDKDPWFRYSASVGIAENGPDDVTFESVFKRADEAMYEEKASFKSKYGTFR